MSGFFGIGGGFLIVPALMLATGMPIMYAVGSSLVAVTAFGLTTAASYAWSGLIRGGWPGCSSRAALPADWSAPARRGCLSERRGALNIVFAVGHYCGGALYAGA